MTAHQKRCAAAAAVYVVIVAIAGVLNGGLNWLAVVLVAGQVVLFASDIGINERLENTRADVDQARDDVGDVKAHLTGNDQPSTGRHAHSDQQPRYPRRPSPRPRSTP